MTFYCRINRITIAVINKILNTVDATMFLFRCLIQTNNNEILIKRKITNVNAETPLDFKPLIESFKTEIS